MNGKLVGEVISWTIVAAIIVLIIMNAKNFAVAITSIGNFWTTETSMFTGSNYNSSTYGKMPNG